MAEEKPGCGRAGSVMLVVCSLPLLAVGLTLMIVFVTFKPAYIAGIVLVSLAAFMLVCGIATGIASCVIRQQQKISDVYQANYKDRRGSQTTTYTTATMETVATRLTVAPPMSSYVNETEGETPPPPPYSHLVQVAPQSSIDRHSFTHSAESGQELGQQRF